MGDRRAMLERSVGKTKVRYRIVSGLFDLIVLELLLEGGLGAFDIIRLVYERFGTLISPGTMYPRLKTLKKFGLILEVSNGRRRIFILTPQARQMLSVIREEYDQIHSSMTMLIGHGRTGNSQIQR